MDDPHDDTESIVSRLTPSQRIVVPVLLSLILVTSVGIVAGQQTDWFEDFEDGNMDDWSTSSITSSDPIFGSYSFTDSTDFNNRAHRELPSPQPETVSAYIRIPSGSIDDTDGDDSYRGFGVYDGSAFGAELEAPFVAFDQGEAIAANDGGFASTGINLQGDTVYRVILHDIDWSSETYDVRIENVEGDVIGTESGFDFNPSDIDAGEFTLYTDDGRWYVDNIAVGEVAIGHSLSGTVTDQNGNEIENATVAATNETGTEVANVSTNEFGDYQTSLINGTYDVTAAKDGYFSQTETVTIAGEEATQDFQLTNFSEALIIDTKPFLEHGQSSPYQVNAAIHNDTTGEIDRFGVTTDATVTSADTNVVTTDVINQEVVATSDTSVNNRTHVQAEWTDPDTGQTYTTQANVTVANKTVDNLGILPAWTKISAVIGGGTDDNPGDRTFLLILIGTALAAAVSRIATSLAGLGALTSILLMGWILGMTNDGLAIVTVLTAMFIGMNVAGNVDYQVRK